MGNILYLSSHINMFLDSQSLSTEFHFTIPNGNCKYDNSIPVRV